MRSASPPALLNHRSLPWVLVGICALLIAVECGIARTSQFSPDSWSYLELAKTVFSERFFEFNTYRSYVSDRHSASFPLGYPVLLALAHLPFGAHPAVGVVLNFTLALASALLLIGIARRLGQPPLIQAILASSLLLYPQYVNEILSARAIPAALLCFIAATWLSLSRRHFLAGLMLGLSALIRFDFLANALLFLGGFACLYAHGRIRSIAAMSAGLVAGLLPWITYSLLFFGRWWVSDNSWVALSAAPALVLDYPAEASATLMNNPAQWLGRILHNVSGLLASLAASAPGYPAFIVIVCVLLWSVWKRSTSLMWRDAAVLALATASLAPYILTGYFDARYFTLFFVTLSVVVLSRANLASIPLRGQVTACLLFGLVALVAVVRLLGYTTAQSEAYAATAATENALIARLSACHEVKPETRFIFAGEALNVSFKYGALTGGRAAAIPSNFYSMDAPTRASYFSDMQPYQLVDSLSAEFSCH